MRMLATLRTFVSTQEAKRWSADERLALVRFFYDAVTADEVIAAAELEALEAAAATYQVGLSDAVKLDQARAMATLTKTPAHLKVACLLVADVFFSDGDLDVAERRFIDELSTKYQIRDAVLKDVIERRRRQSLDAALRALHDEVFGAGSTPPPETELEEPTHRRGRDDT
jgi:uncharacterized tellurite resistance protein B-like protein